MDNLEKTEFSELSAENKEIAEEEIFFLHKKYDYPSEQIFESSIDVKKAIEEGYDPEDYFSFYLDEFQDIIVKIG